MSNNPLLSEIYKGWETYQDNLIRAISPLTAERLALQISPQLRSVMTLAGHIISARVYWFHSVMQEGPADLAPMQMWDEEGEPARSADELVKALEETWAIMEAGFKRWNDSDMAETFARPVSGLSVTRQWIIWHVLEHDLHHGGELSFVLGAHGVPAIDL